MKKTFAVRVIKKIAPRIGAKVILEPDYNRVGQIVFKNGKKTLFRGHKFNINSMASIEIAKDKGYAKFFLARAGFRVALGQTFFDDYMNSVLSADKQRTINDAIIYLKTSGLPAIVKPNDSSQGKLVAKIYNAKDLRYYAKKIFKETHVLLLEKFYPGNDYRIVVLDGQVISGYQRLPLCIVGDGKQTIQELMKQKQETFIKQGRDTRLDLNDPRLAAKLKQQKLTFNFSLSRGEKINLLDNANLSTGGESIDCTSNIHPSYKKLAIKITEEMGLRFCGVDLITAGKITEPLSDYTVLEINSAPGLSNYAQSGAKQNKIVEQLYLQVLKSLEKN